MSYRNCWYDHKKSQIHHFTWTTDGLPSRIIKNYKPYLLVPSPSKDKQDGIGIDGVPLLKREFNNNYERTKFVKTCQTKIYYNLPPTQQYLLDLYHNKDINELTANPLRTFFFDIEVIADEFPNPMEAKYPITSITIFDTLKKKYFTWGINPYDDYSCKDDLTDVEPEEIVYDYCQDETVLLKKFVRFWRANFPDIICGYNSFSFDQPYIVNRLEHLFGEGYSKNLSPVNSIYGKETTNRFGQQYIEYELGGIAHIDYMVLYKYFTPGERESDSLDFVTFSELGKGKLEYGDKSLQELCNEDWDKFINYNIWDVKLLVMLDAKKKYLEIAKFSAFSGFCNLDKAFGKTAIITGVLAKQSLEDGKYISTQKGADDAEKIPGGYVKQPEEGLYEDVVSFDANSLYPSNIITLNISPETKVAKIIKTENDIHTILLTRKNKTVEIAKDKLHDILKQKNWSLAANGVMYDQNVKGIAASFCDVLYQKRKKVKNEMFQIEKQMELLDKDSLEYNQLKTLSSQKDVEQYLYKILLNSTYGAFANRYFALYELDCATSITTSGQAMIKKSANIVNDYLVSEWGLEKKDRIIFSDTDSLGVSLKDIMQKVGVDIFDENRNLTDGFNEIENKISDHLNKEINTWAIEKLNSADPRFVFKRESVCPKAMWMGKKHYVMYILNKEGKKMNTFKYSGVRLAKSTLSARSKDISKKIVEIIMGTKDQKIADQMIFDAYEEFKTFSVNDIAERGGIKVLSKWDTKNNGLNTAKGTTRAAKLSIWHNELIKTNNLENVYRKIENGSKIKMLHIKDNKYNLPGIAYQDQLPKEFGLEADYEKMFFYDIIKSLEPMYDALKWKMPDPKLQYEATLEEIFG